MCMKKKVKINKTEKKLLLIKISTKLSIIEAILSITCHSRQISIYVAAKYINTKQAGLLSLPPDSVQISESSYLDLARIMPNNCINSRLDEEFAKHHPIVCLISLQKSKIPLDYFLTYILYPPELPLLPERI